MGIDCRIYRNSGNEPLINLLVSPPKGVLDIGCGAGDNAALIRRRYPGTTIEGITVSEAEKEAASCVLDRCWIFDIEQDIPAELAAKQFDVLVFSHVLEHLREPALVLSRFAKLLAPSGVVLIAVPNVLGWRQRLQFLIGRFEYESAGVLDNTHLRFFTWFTADRYLFGQSSELKMVKKGVTGGVPLWWLRRHILPKNCSERIDQLGCRYLPNLFGGQILIKALKS